jgi:hypothetical protein
MKPTKEKYILLLLIIFVAMPMWGEDSKEEGDFDVNKIRYTPIAGTTDEVEVKHKKWYDRDTFGNEYYGNIIIPETVSYLDKTYRVTAIGEWAFSSSWITAVSIPNSVTDIGNNAFAHTLITSISIPNSVTNIGYYAFAYTSIENITLPASLKTIDQLMFQGCKKLKSVVLPDSLLSIESYAFYGCDSLNVITLSANVKHIGKHIAPYGKISISPDNPYYILDSGVLYNKDKTILYDAYPSDIIGDFIIPETVKTIADNAFYDCDKLTSVVIPSTVNHIGKNTFYGCSELKSVILPDSITEIGYRAFDGCKKLSNISIPKQVIHIGWRAFEQTAWFASQTDTMVYINNVLYHCNVALADLVWVHDHFVLTNSLYGLRKAAKAARATRVTIEIREGTINITQGAFDSSSNIKSISIPSSVRRMVTDVLQVKTLAEINVYWDDPSLVSIIEQHTEEPATTEIWIPQRRTLIVPKGTKEKYIKAAVWGKFKIKERKK